MNQKNEAVPAGVVEVLHRMMARKPADRYQTPDELLDELEFVDTRPDQASEKFLATLSDTVLAATESEVASPRAPQTSHQALQPLSRGLNGTASEPGILKYTVAAMVGGAVAVLVGGFLAFSWWGSSKIVASNGSPSVVVAQDVGAVTAVQPAEIVSADSQGDQTSGDSNRSNGDTATNPQQGSKPTSSRQTQDPVPHLTPNQIRYAKRVKKRVDDIRPYIFQNGAERGAEYIAGLIPLFSTYERFSATDEDRKTYKGIVDGLKKLVNLFKKRAPLQDIETQIDVLITMTEKLPWNLLLPKNRQPKQNQQRTKRQTNRGGKAHAGKWRSFLPNENER